MKNEKQILFSVLEELKTTFSALKWEQLTSLKDHILKSDKIFVAGAGRSLLMIRAFAMRLMHMGLTTYVVGETVTPAITKKDLLIIASGSGKTETLVAIAGKCKKIGATLALITAIPDSPIGTIADIIIHIPAATTKNDKSVKSSIQLGSATFEQSVLLTGDTIILSIADKYSLEDSNKKLMIRHANLE